MPNFLLNLYHTEKDVPLDKRISAIFEALDKSRDAPENSRMIELVKNYDRIIIEKYGLDHTCPVTTEALIVGYVLDMMNIPEKIKEEIWERDPLVASYYDSFKRFRSTELDKKSKICEFIAPELESIKQSHKLR